MTKKRAKPTAPKPPPEPIFIYSTADAYSAYLRFGEPWLRLLPEAEQAAVRAYAAQQQQGKG